jgi:hypothetical protein
MALPNNNVSTAMVRNELGENTYNIGKLCTSNKINMWSPKKPYSLIAPAPTNAEMVKSSPPANGLWRLTDGSVVYRKPTGGASDPYRLGDFRGYNKSALPPCYAEVDQTTIVEGEIDWVTISLHIGSINPTSIAEATNPIKRTMGEGYGGIAIAERGKRVGSKVSSDKVFSADGTPHAVRIDSNLFDLYYVERTIEGEYIIVGGTKPYLIEDLSYRDAITVEPFGVSMLTPTFIWRDYRDPMGPDIFVSVPITNYSTSERSFGITVTAKITNAVVSGRTISPLPDSMTLASGETKTYSVHLSTAYVTQGENTVSCAIRLTHNGVEVDYRGAGGTFTASAPM